MKNDNGLEATVVLKADTSELRNALEELGQSHPIGLSSDNVATRGIMRERARSLGKAFDSAKAGYKYLEKQSEREFYTDPAKRRAYRSQVRFDKKMRTDEKQEASDIKVNERERLEKIKTDTDKVLKDNTIAFKRGLLELKSEFDFQEHMLEDVRELSKHEHRKIENTHQVDENIRLSKAQSEINKSDKLFYAELSDIMGKQENERLLTLEDNLLKLGRESAIMLGMSRMELDMIHRQRISDLDIAEDAKKQANREEEKRKTDDHHKNNILDVINDRDKKRTEYLLLDDKLKRERRAFRSPIDFDDIDNLIGVATGRIIKDSEDYEKFELTVGKIKNIAKGIAFGAITAFITKTLTSVFNVGKSIVKVFSEIAKQTEVFKTIVSLFVAPLSLLFTLLFVPLLTAILPLITTMFSWVTSNKDAIMAVGEKLGEVFTPDKLDVVTKALDGILLVVNELANVFSNNTSMIDTTSLSGFISSTILAITNMVQDILLGLIAFCYSPEGQSFINSVAYSVGKLIGSILTTIVALLPVIFQSIHVSIMGVINGIFSTLTKAVFAFLDMVDGMTGGALSGFVNTIINLINSAINMLNSINLFGFSPFNIPTVGQVSFGTLGSSVSNSFDQGIVNNYNINNMLSLNNANALKDVMRTGVY